MIQKPQSHLDFIKKFYRKNVANAFISSRALSGGDYRALRSIGLWPYRITAKETRQLILEKYEKGGTFIEDRKNLYIYVLLPEIIVDFDMNEPTIGYFICDFT